MSDKFTNVNTTITRTVMISKALHHPNAPLRITSWPEDPDHPGNAAKFVQDCRDIGMPCFQSGRTAYIYSTPRRLRK